MTTTTRLVAVARYSACVVIRTPPSACIAWRRGEDEELFAVTAFPSRGGGLSAFVDSIRVSAPASWTGHRRHIPTVGRLSDLLRCSRLSLHTRRVSMAAPAAPEAAPARTFEAASLAADSSSGRAIADALT